CYGGNTASATVNVTGGSPPYSYFWSTGDSTQTVSNLFADSISVIVFDTNGCSGTDDYVVTQPPPIQSNIVNSVYNGGFNVSCFGASDGYAVLSVTGG